MATEVLAVGTDGSSSGDIVVAATTIIALKEFQPQAEVVIELEDDDGAFWPVDNLNGVSRISAILLAAATYRVTRRDKGEAGECGVFTG